MESPFQKKSAGKKLLSATLIEIEESKNLKFAYVHMNYNQVEKRLPERYVKKTTVP